MDNIVELSGRELDYLRAVIDMAIARQQSVRIVTQHNGLKVARGQSMWSAPLNNGNNS